MGFFDNFKSSKAQEIKKSQGVNAPAAPKKKEEEKSVEAKTTKKPAAKSSKAGSGSAGKAPAKKTEGKNAVSETKTVVKNDRRISGRLATIIERPLVTEKAARLASEGKYVFVVRKDAGRIEISQAIRAMYGIVPESVNIQNVHGKRMRFGRRRGKRASWKKAIVSMPKGKTIDVYEGV